MMRCIPKYIKHKDFAKDLSAELNKNERECTATEVRLKKE
jgi:hypothetical protein